ncbi:fibronectin-like isoform X2 [Phyllopteryx taeniolatus]|uniref:fibronectin-like isoform X2 n=1 Tax=Phyllopteryx taeniolatus TaxID=161469 RepID=UPI002AD38C3A|nr:fibronectin-like isoform X2 [Phyllopteryx taeniolatus]
MSKMGWLGAIGFCFALLTLTQISYNADGCQILTAAPSGPSSILVKWKQYTGATNYFLDLRVKNIRNIAPVVVTLPATQTEKIVRGLQPGTNYSVTLKVFQFYFVVCVDRSEASTVPDTSQIIDGKALSSTSIVVKWSEVPSAEQYLLQVRSEDKSQIFNLTITELSTVLGNLTPSTNYDCFVYTINHAGMGSRSKVRTVTTLTQPPVGVTVTQTGRETARVMWLPVEDVLLYHVEVQNIDEPNNEPTVYNVSDTSVDLDTILPCSTYTISVSSFSWFLMPSEPTLYTYTTNKLTPVSAVSVDYSCASQSAMVRWTAVFGADSYKATAMGQDGTLLTCTSQGTKCHISGLSCGQTFMVHVTPMSENCKNMINTTWATFQTVPCPPKNLELLRHCSSEVIIFSWEHTNKTDHYMARGVDSKGVVQECLTVDNSCYFTNTMCGRQYYFTVYSTSGECKSQTSSTVDIRTAPCIPQNLQTSADCNSNLLVSKWDLAEGALRYTVEAYGNKGHSHYNCSTHSDSCVIESIPCGEYLTIFITAFDDECASPRRLGPVAETVPCTPHNVTAVNECGADSITVTWAVSGSTLFYDAMAMDSSGIVHSCNTMDLTCTIAGLKCSTSYTTYVIGSNFKCNSTQSEAVTTETAACPPSNVTASLNCEANEALISWHGQPEINSYTVTIVDKYDRLLSCSSTETTCGVPTLKCGQLYTVTVFHHDSICPSMPSQPIYMESAPCVPTNVVARTNCGQSYVEVSWQASRGALHYDAAATPRDGHQLSCASNETSCRMEGLMCSQVCHIVVSAGNNNCFSNESAKVLVLTAPCPPSQLNVSVNCTSNIATLSWNSSPNAVSYTSKAVSADGHTVTCAAATNLVCHLEYLHCGKEYSFTVSATNGDCQSPESKPVIHETAPCIVQNVVKALNCSTNMLTISWVPGIMPINYSCGTQYDLTVAAVSGTCEGPRSLPETMNSGPCVPVNVQSIVECYSNTVYSSWDPAPGALWYISALTGVGGYTSSCSTSEQSCQFPGLRCAHAYMLSVVAQNNQCNSSESTEITVTTAPCEPASVGVSFDCISGVAKVMWEHSSGSQYYTVLAEAIGHNDTCNSTMNFCELSQVLCGEDYTVTVLAENGVCTSTSHAQTNVTTAPCPPRIQAHSLDCATNQVSVSWLQDEDAIKVTVSATSSVGHSTSCDSTTDLSCTLSGLLCGHTYTFHAVAQGTQCSSNPSSTFEIVSAPCTPTNMVHTYSCTTGLATVSWDDTLGSNNFYANAYSPNHMTSCSSTQTDCSLPSLSCGSMYNVTVMAVSDHCNSSMSSVTQILTAPCAPTDVQAALLCDDNTAAVSWQPSSGATWYNVTAHSTSGDIKQCSTNDTRCHLPGMNCDHTYDVIVTPLSDLCHGLGSDPYTYIAGPCPPTNVQGSLQCNGSVVHVTWNAARRADYYEATAVTSMADHHGCNSSDTYCTLTGLNCGETAVISVVTVGRGCWSKPSLPLLFQSVICPPASVAGVTTCANNDITVRWDPSPESGATYRIHAEEEGGASAMYSATQTYHVISGLQCGQLYTLEVAAIDTECTSALSPTVQTETAPCPPANLTVNAECGTNFGVITWAPSAHAINYTATVTGTHGHVVTCFSESTMCSVKLDCGYQYTATVVASSSTCVSLTGAVVTFESAPCPPTQLHVDSSCDSNNISVSWQASHGSVTYMVVAENEQGQRWMCNTSSTSCYIAGLQCGQQYQVYVVGLDEKCIGAKSDIEEMTTAPCVPWNIQNDLDCLSGVLNITWQSTGYAPHFHASVASSKGDVSMCITDMHHCIVQGMQCGLTYSVTVVSQDDACNSSHSPIEQVTTVPCVPQMVTAEMLCSDNIGVVSWEEGEGVSSYMLQAFGPSGHQIECNNTKSSCQLPHMRCGQLYNLTVTALDGRCDNSQSYLNLQSVPCRPTDVKASLQCHSNSVAVTWKLASGAVSYHAVGVTSDGTHQTECNNTMTYCKMSELQCGQTYNVSVFGQDESCSSVESETIFVQTAPCPPQGVIVDALCDEGAMSVSWSHNPDAHYFHVVAASHSGARLYCNSSGTVCTFENLPCGDSYNVTLVSVRNDCESEPSPAVEIHSGPCALTSINTVTQCNSDSILVEWEMSNETPFYIVTAEGHGQSMISCNSTSSSCELQDVRCDMQYSIIVSASSDKCSSLRSPPTRIKTVPCTPNNLTVMSTCEDNGPMVTWAHSPVATSYLMTAVGKDGHTENCNTSVNNCTLADLHCGQPYNLSVTARGDNCTSEPTTASFTTVPCPPSTLTVDFECEDIAAILTWTSAEGAVKYYGRAQTMEGEILSCDSANNSCTIKGLQCGGMYNFSVEASDSFCNSSLSAPVEKGAAPCAPTALDVRMQKIDQNHWLMSSWETVNCSGVEYLVEIFGRIQDNSQALMSLSSYWLSVPYFETLMPCGTTYNLTVRSRNSAGTSKPSRAFTGVTVPCAPMNVQYSGGSQSAVLSWEASVLATSYSVYDVSGEGSVVLCTTAGLSCQLTNFSHGSIAVTASNVVGESLPSSNLTGPVGTRRKRHLWASMIHANIDKALGIPNILNVALNGVSIHVRWTPVKDATEYTLIMVEEQREQHYPPRVRIVEGSFYTETDLKPRTTYCIRMAARTPISQSSYSRPKCRTTGASK